MSSPAAPFVPLAGPLTSARSVDRRCRIDLERETLGERVPVEVG